MVEQAIHSIVPAPHNIALVDCASAPFCNRQLVLGRGQHGPKLQRGLDKVAEDTLQGNAPDCIVFIVALWIIGIAMPLNHLLFHGALRDLHVVATAALVLKLAAAVLTFSAFLGFGG